VELKESVKLLDVMVEQELAESKSAARRLLKEGAVSINGERVSDANLVFDSPGEYHLRVGKHRFLKLVLRTP
jgi:tyrosyl-tRNA synthetase